MSLVVNNSSAVMSVRRSGTATVVCRVAGVALADSIGDIVFEFLVDAKSAGVRIVAQWSESTPATTFTLDVGPGLDHGHLASALST
jgi:hypothetical protein